MWVINQRGKVEIRSNNIEQNISSVLAQDFPEAEIYVSLENCINQVNSTLFQTVEKEGEPIEFEQVLQDENGEPVLDAAGEKVLEKFTAPGPSIVESAGNTLAMEGSCLLVCDKNENELGRWALRLVRTGLG